MIYYLCLSRKTVRDMLLRISFALWRQTTSYSSSIKWQNRILQTRGSAFFFLTVLESIRRISVKDNFVAIENEQQYSESNPYVWNRVPCYAIADNLCPILWYQSTPVGALSSTLLRRKRPADPPSDVKLSFSDCCFRQSSNWYRTRCNLKNQEIQNTYKNFYVIETESVNYVNALDDSIFMETLYSLK